MDDLPDYIQLFGDSEGVKMFADGNPRSKEKVTERLTNWVKRWENNDPFSPFRVELKDGTFIGFVVLGYGDEVGESELAYMLDKNYRSQGYGTEMVAAVVHEVATEIIQRDYEVNRDDEEIANAPLASICATSRLDNEPSNKLLQKLGFNIRDVNEKFGHTRNIYVLHL
jgi:RimJ/RimL family protein N-acetyltransferase